MHLRLGIVREPLEPHELGLESEHPRRLDQRRVVDDRRLGRFGPGEASGVQLEPAEPVSGEAALLGLGLGAGALEQMIQVERPVPGEHDDHREAAQRELPDGRADPGMHELSLEGQREGQVEAAAGEVDGWQDDAAAEPRRAQAERMGLERVDAERKVLTVELERPDRHERDRRACELGAKLRRMEAFVAPLDAALVRRGAHPRGGWKSSSEMPSWIRRYEAFAPRFGPPSTSIGPSETTGIAPAATACSQLARASSTWRQR